MDALKFIKEHKRMCDMYGDDGCDQCPLSFINNELGMACEDLKNVDPEQYVFIVEEWSSDHSVKTRQSEFLKMFPNAEIRNGFIRICPKKMDQNSITSEECAKIVCQDCMRKYWLQEVD